MQPAPVKIEISIPAQELRIKEGDDVVATFPVSTSRHGIGSEEGSYRTPIGKFRIAECVGAGAPEGTIFKSRRPEGIWDGASRMEEDLVMTRILWLDGMEPGNANSRERYIYIHGTNREDRIGEPASIGCVRMRNADVVALYDAVGVGTEVEILV